MIDCTKCKYAEWTYETYYGTKRKQWFVDGCRKDLDEEDCEEFEEIEDERWIYPQRGCGECV